MNKDTIQTEAPDHKTEDTFFRTTDGQVYLLFGATDEVILARLCVMVDGRIVLQPLAQVDYSRFDDWTDETKADNNLNLSGRIVEPTSNQEPSKMHLLPYADQLAKSDNELCQIANQPLDDSDCDLPTIIPIEPESRYSVSGDGCPVTFRTILDHTFQRDAQAVWLTSLEVDTLRQAGWQVTAN